MKNTRDELQLNDIEPDIQGVITALNDNVPTEQETDVAMAKLDTLIASKEPTPVRATSIFAKIFAWLKTLSMAPMPAMGALTAGLVMIVFVGVLSSTPNQAFANVIDKLSSISTMIYNAEFFNGKTAFMTNTVYYTAPSNIRSEVKPVVGGEENTTTTIVNGETGEGFIVLNDGKNIVPFDATYNADDDSPQNDPLFWLKEIKNHSGDADEILGIKTLNGEDVIGYRIFKAHYQMDLWVSTEKQLPVVVELIFNQQGGDDTTFRMSAQVQFDQAIDPKMYSIGPKL